MTAHDADEIDNGLWFVDVCQRNGNMDLVEANEWRRRVLARQRVLAPSDDHSQTH